MDDIELSDNNSTEDVASTTTQREQRKTRKRKETEPNPTPIVYQPQPMVLTAALANDIAVKKPKQFDVTTSLLRDTIPYFRVAHTKTQLVQQLAKIDSILGELKFFADSPIKTDVLIPKKKYASYLVCCRTKRSTLIGFVTPDRVTTSTSNKKSRGGTTNK